MPKYIKTLCVTSFIETLTLKLAIPILLGNMFMKSQTTKLYVNNRKILFRTTNNDVYSLFAFAKSLHTITIAIHLARPIKINPDIYSGSFLKNRTAKPNIKTVPITQFNIKEMAITFLSFRALGNKL